MNQKEVNQNDLDILLDKTNWSRLGLNPDKSLFLIGPPGVGKTFFMRRWIKAQGVYLNELIAYDVEKGFVKEGLDYPNMYSHGDMFIDDIGIESDMINIFGTKHYPVQTLIFYRHNKYINNKYLTHFTSNLNYKAIKEKYGERVLDRLYEMCNFVIVTGTSYRIR